MHLDGALAILGSLSEIGVDATKSQNDGSFRLATDTNYCGSIRHGSTTDWEHLVSALSRLGGQLSSFGTLYGGNWSEEENMVT